MARTPIAQQYFEIEAKEGHAETLMSPAQVGNAEASGLEPPHRAPELFDVRPYIPQANRFVIVEDSALADSQVAFALATSLVLQKTRKG